MVFDLFHHACYAHFHPKEAPDDLAELFPRILKTWGTRRAIMHISEQAVDWEKIQSSGTWISREQPKIGAHSAYISEIPIWFLDLLVKHEARVDLEIEAKAKEQAILKLYQLYPQIFLTPSASPTRPVSSVSRSGSGTTADLSAAVQKLTLRPSAVAGALHPPPPPTGGGDKSSDDCSRSEGESSHGVAVAGVDRREGRVSKDTATPTVATPRSLRLVIRKKN